jgi:uroporphyrinogen-III synthase
MRRVLVLRPEPDASRTVARARDRGLDAIAVPLFEIEPVPWEAPDPHGFQGLLLTSANAVRHGGEQLHGLSGLPVYAVGEATADAARDAGFGIEAIGSAGVDRLLASIAADVKLLHLCGEDRRAAASARQQIVTIPAYRAIAVEGRDVSAAAGAVVLIHSPRAGRRFAELGSDRRPIALAAISAAAAEAAGGGWEIVEAAEQPTDDALLALAARLCNNPPPK